MTSPQEQPPLRILIVDDSRTIRQITRNAIENHFNTEFFEAQDGDQALQVLQEQHVMDSPIDLIFLDWMMPKCSGFEFLQAIRETEVFKNSPAVVMLTAETYSEQLAAALELGVSCYITKPYGAAQIREALLKALPASHPSSKS